MFAVKVLDALVSNEFKGSGSQLVLFDNCQLRNHVRSKVGLKN